MSQGCQMIPLDLFESGRMVWNAARFLEFSAFGAWTVLRLAKSTAGRRLARAKEDPGKRAE